MGSLDRRAATRAQRFRQDDPRDSLSETFDKRIARLLFHRRRPDTTRDAALCPLITARHRESAFEARPGFDVTVAPTPDKLASDESSCGELRRRRHPRGTAARGNSPYPVGWTVASPRRLHGRSIRQGGSPKPFPQHHYTHRQHCQRKVVRV